MSHCCRVQRGTILLNANQRSFSIQLFLAALISVSITATCGQGGEPVVDKNVAPPPPELYGTGWYAAIDMGANVFQIVAALGHSPMSSAIRSPLIRRTMSAFSVE